MRFAIPLVVVLAVCSLAMGQELLTNGGWESSSVDDDSAGWAGGAWTGIAGDLNTWWGEYRDMRVVEADAGALYPAPPEGVHMIAREDGHQFTNLVQVVENTDGFSKFDLSGWYGGYNDAALQIGLVWLDTALPASLGDPDLNASFQGGFDGGAVTLDLQGVDTEAETGMMVSFSEQVDIGYAPAYVGLRIMYGTWTDDPDAWYALDGMSLQGVVTDVPGDADGDGVVDLTDLGILATNWGRTDVTVGAAEGDFDDSGAVDLSDLGILATNWGTGTQAVPEPATMSLLSLGGLALLKRTRKS